MATATTAEHLMGTSTALDETNGLLHRSFRLRLTLVVTALVAAVLVLLIWAANRGLDRIVIQSGQERAQGAAVQMATALGQNTARGVVEMQRLATDSALSDYLKSPTDGGRALIAEHLKVLATAAQPPVELLNGTGERILEITAPNGRSRPLPVPRAVDAAPPRLGVGPFQMANGILFADVIVAVRAPRDDAAPAEASTERLGYLRSPRIIQPGPNAEFIGRLVGAGGTVALGNQIGDVWTNFQKAVPRPPMETSHNGSAAYAGLDGQPHVGGVGLIDGTPWAVWIDLPEHLVLAPARAILNRLMVLAIIGLVLAAVAMAWLSGRITRPLHDLTEASEAIAAGDYGRRVPVDRRDELGRLSVAFNTMTERVTQAHRELEARVEERTAQLQARAAELAAVNHELETFSFSVSHDLRAPLRHITGFAALLEQSAVAKLDADEQRRLRTIGDAAGRMGQLIDDLLAFSRNGRVALTKRRLRLDDLVRDARQELAGDPQSARVNWTVHPLPEVAGDAALLRLVFVNLVSNAVKYSRDREAPEVEIGAQAQTGGEVVVFVRDNGVGFDMAYADKLFGVFQRLHGQEQFEGTGIGLANVRRIVHRHGGRTWAEGVVNGGATFYFSLPTDSPVITTNV